jgi:hypothetical protein
MLALTLDLIASSVKSLSLDKRSTSKTVINLDKKAKYNKAESIAINLIYSSLFTNNKALVNKYNTIYIL